MAAIRKESLVDQVYGQLKSSIVKMEIPLGTKLNVSRIQNDYGVSSTPVREALNRLLNDGLIEFENNVGARVISLEQRDVREILEVLVSYELAGLCYAIHKCDCQKMGEEYRRCVEQYKNSGNCVEYAENLNAAKKIIYKYADNTRLQRNVVNSVSTSELMTTIFFMDEEEENEKKYQEELPFLEEICQAIFEENVAKGCAAIEKRMSWMEQYIYQNLEKVKISAKK